MLFLLPLLPAFAPLRSTVTTTTPRPAASESITITRALPDADDLLCRSLSELAVNAFYGSSSAWDGPVASIQRSLLVNDVLDDVRSRLSFYEEARCRQLPFAGAVFLVEDMETNAIIGFADVGMTLYNARKRTFRLPRAPEGPPAATLQQQPHLSSRPYISNLAVDESWRKRGVGRRLMEACEAEAARWGEESVWLEVSLSNGAARSFYDSLGYTMVDETRGRDVIRKRWSYVSEPARRGLMRKDVARPAAAAAAVGDERRQRRSSVPRDSGEVEVGRVHPVKDV
jgi:ribosomal protein S18 acetylase RimI-like enzyme